MSVRMRGLVSRWAAPVVIVTLLPFAAGPAAAASHAVPTRLVVHVAPATVHVGSPLVVSGSVSPQVAGVPVVLQRLVGKAWHTVAHGKASARGTFSFSVKTPAAAAHWALRVTRGAKTVIKAGVSATLTVRVVKAIFVVKAAASSGSVTSGQPVVVTGSVLPKATGSVSLQRLVGRTWATLATARLTASAFRFSTVRPAGAYRLRVLKAYSTTVAGGVSPAFTVTVLAAPVTPLPPTVTTNTLAAGTVGVPYSVTLTAAGGTPPYLWTSAGLPAGLTMSTGGVVSGTPTSAGSSTVTVAVTDGSGRRGTAALALTVAARPRPVGRLYAWGENDNGQLGNSTTESSSPLVSVTGLTSIVEVTAGGASAYALRSDGTVWAWGSGFFGRLGNGSTTSSSSPVQVTGLTSVTAIAGGSQTAYALKSDGTVWSWGYNSTGQLGSGSTDLFSSTPVQVSGLTSVTAIAGGLESASALKSDGTVWTWGFNEYGQGTYNHTYVPVQVSGLSSVTAIATGIETGYALLSNGTVMAWGNNQYGELGDNSADTTHSSPPVAVTGLSSVTGVAAGGFTGYALLASGRVWAWGLDDFGQLGDGGTSPSPVPVQVTALSGITAIAAGYFDGYAQAADGHEWAWGQGSLGQLGDGGTHDGGPVQVRGLTGVVGIGGSQSTFSGYAIAAD